MGLPAFKKALHELRRGIGITRRSGLGAGAIFMREEILRNGLTRLQASWQQDRPDAVVECNLCGWRGPRFLTHYAGDYIDRDCFCPRCHSYPRHRGFAWLLRNELGDRLAALEELGGLRLVFAPEAGMLALLGEQVSRLEGVDLVRINEHVVRLEDLQRLSFEDESVDFVSCFHVLEHVPQDRQALGELHRVLAPKGLLILCVPISFGRQESIDFGGPNPRLNDHCFDYGEDFVERLLEANFSGEAYRLLDAVPAELHRSLGMAQELVFLLQRTPEGATPKIVDYSP